MFLLKRLSLVSFALALLVALSASAFAQEPSGSKQGQTPDAGARQRPFGRGEGRGGPGPGGMLGPRMLHELNLTDDQRQQVRTIIGQSMEGTKAQREELRQLGEKRFQGILTADEQARAKTLHQGMRASMKESESKIVAILTPEQKAKLDELRKQREQNHGRFGERRGDFPPDKGNPPTQKPAAPPAGF